MSMMDQNLGTESFFFLYWSSYAHKHEMPIHLHAVCTHVLLAAHWSLLHVSRKVLSSWAVRTELRQKAITDSKMGMVL